MCSKRLKERKKRRLVCFVIYECRAKSRNKTQLYLYTQNTIFNTFHRFIYRHTLHEKSFLMRSIDCLLLSSGLMVAQWIQQTSLFFHVSARRPVAKTIQYSSIFVHIYGYVVSLTRNMKRFSCYEK